MFQICVVTATNIFVRIWNGLSYDNCARAYIHDSSESNESRVRDIISDIVISTFTLKHVLLSGAQDRHPGIQYSNVFEA